MNWLSAFKAMLTGTEKTLGRNYKWKRGFLLLAITGTIASPFLVWKTTLPYQGEIPRDEQLIKATGTLSYKVVRRGIKEYGYVEFDTDDGRSYQSWGNVVYGRLRDFSEPHNVGKVYMEGFVLENGRGSFWRAK